jgi:hypothetical protein
MEGKWEDLVREGDGWVCGDGEGRGRLVRLKGEEAENSKAQSQGFLWFSLKGRGGGLSVDEFRFTVSLCFPNFQNPLFSVCVVKTYI